MKSPHSPPLRKGGYGGIWLIAEMWVEFKQAPNLMMAEMWKEVLEGEGLPTRILPEGDILDWGERVPFKIYVPKGREHVAEEILRKL